VAGHALDLAVVEAALLSAAERYELLAEEPMGVS
jgi:hypothetical protein